MQGHDAGTNSSSFKPLILQIIVEVKDFWVPAEHGVYEEPLKAHTYRRRHM